MLSDGTKCSTSELNFDVINQSLCFKFCYATIGCLWSNRN